MFPPPEKPPDPEPGDERAIQDAERQHSWHVKCLTDLGVSWDTADTYGDDVDPHEVKALVDQGCPPDLAVQIRLKR